MAPTLESTTRKQERLIANIRSAWNNHRDNADRIAGYIVALVEIHNGDDTKVFTLLRDKCEIPVEYAEHLYHYGCGKFEKELLFDMSKAASYVRRLPIQVQEKIAVVGEPIPVLRNDGTTEMKHYKELSQRECRNVFASGALRNKVSIRTPAQQAAYIAKHSQTKATAPRYKTTATGLYVSEAMTIDRKTLCAILRSVIEAGKNVTEVEIDLANYILRVAM